MGISEQKDKHQSGTEKNRFSARAHNGTEGGGAETQFEVCLIRLSCKDLDDNPLLGAVIQLSRDAEIMKETATDGRGEVTLNIFPGRYNINVRVDEAIVGEGNISLWQEKLQNRSVARSVPQSSEF